MKICLTGDRARRLRELAVPMLAAAGVDAEFVILERDGRFEGNPDGIEVAHFSLIVTRYPEATQALMGLFKSPTLRWMQGPGAGVEHPIWQGLLDRGVRLTNASGIHSEPIAQYIFTYVLHWERNVERHRRQQASKTWEIIRSDDLSEKTIGIIGYGGIGQATARVAKAFGMRVLASRRTSFEDEALDRFVPLDELHTLLEESHYVVLCMPLNDETSEMIGAKEFAAMRDDAVLINVARGGVVDEPAMVEVLKAGRIRGATLDVVSEEPLPDTSELWELENCVLTPHDAGYSPLGDERLGALFLDNLGRFARGESLLNEIESTGIA